MTRNNAPRTRKQLRDALREAKDKANALRDAIHSAGFGTEEEQIGWAHFVTLTGTQRTLFVDNTPVATQRQANDAVNAVTKAAVTATRREILEKVIEALELTQYAAKKPTLEALLSSSYGAAQTLPRVGADRFWDDINTALEVREAEKHAATRAATEKRVAGLTKPKSTFSLSFIATNDDFDPAAPKVSDLTPEPKKKPAKPAKKETKK